MARHMHVRQVFGERIMLKYISNERIFYAAGVAGFGVMGLAFGDFALQLQPVPENLMLRTPLAYACALLLMLGGGATLTDRWARVGFTALGLVFAAWALLFTPFIRAAPLSVGSWLSFAEIASLSIAAWMAAHQMGAGRKPAIFRALRMAFGVCAVIFGLSHFAFPEVTANFVPKYFMAPYFWAYATGLGHIGAGVALISGILARLGTRLWALMMGGFALFVQLPPVIADPTSHSGWMLFLATTTLAGAAWLVHGVLGRPARAPQFTGARDR